MSLCDGDFVTFGDFVRVAGTHDKNIGHGAQGCELFDRLMSGTIFAYADGIVREDINDGNFHESGEADGRFYVVAEIEEGTAEGAKTGERHAAHGRAHGVFAHAVVHVAAGVLAGKKIAGPRSEERRVGKECRS